MAFLVYENGVILLGPEVMLVLGEYRYLQVFKVCTARVVIVATSTSE